MTLMKNNIFKSLAVFLCLILVFAFPCSALSHSTYSDLVQSNSTCQNLILLAMNYEGFAESDYVVYCSAQYTYFIVWGDLTASQGKIESTESVQYIEYSRGTDMVYSYTVGNSSNFTLNFSDVFVSNIDGYGMRSALYEEYNSQNLVKNFFIFNSILLFVILLLKLRKD